MKVLVFDLIGKMAHFRKYYTNSSSLSYYFPPRTTTIGLIAGIIGRERDQYYEDFSEDKTGIAISIKTNLRKKINTVNYIKAENKNELNLSRKEHTQVPLELILPDEYDKELIYRIFFYHRDQNVFDEVVENVKNEKVKFPPYLGISECIGNIKFIYYGDVKEEEKENPEINSIVSVDFISRNNCTIEPYEGALYVKELMPFSFDSNRMPKNSPREYIAEIKKGKIKIRGKIKVKVIEELNENFLFMEE
ncbi:MAG: type I-B CRISPR-associated protein Cas5 [Dictyoglomus sp. NZ13-RE01]|nr:MAG: type I-B CRISPR-associated protein Cas5 [Dictyoglomus sp. NZ13-RE01]